MNWFRKPKIQTQSVPDLATSILYNEATFYNQFVTDLMDAKDEIIIESPSLTAKRIISLGALTYCPNHEAVKLSKRMIICLKFDSFL